MGFSFLYLRFCATNRLIVLYVFGQYDPFLLFTTLLCDYEANHTSIDIIEVDVADYFPFWCGNPLLYAWFIIEVDGLFTVTIELALLVPLISL